MEEVPLSLDDFSQPNIHTLDHIGSVDHPPDVRCEFKKRNHLLRVLLIRLLPESIKARIVVYA